MKEFLEDIRARPFQWNFEVTPRSNVTVHSLVCKKHLLLYLYSIKTIIENIDYPLQINIYNDGTLGAEEFCQIRRMITGAHIEETPVSGSAEPYEHLPNLARFSQENAFGRRLLHIHANLNDRNIVIDSDVLFFRKADRITQWIADPHDRKFLFNCDENENTVCIEDSDFANLGGIRVPHFNAGLMAFVREDLDLALAEKYFAYLYDREFGGKWVWDQTVWSAMAARSRAGDEPLPRQYTHTFSFLEDYRPNVPLEEVVTRHYSKPKSLFFYEGVKYLIQANRA